MNEVLYQTLDFDGRLKSGNKKLSIDDNGDFVGGEDVTLTTSEDGHIVAAWDDQTGNIYAKNINENTETEINSALLTVSTAAEGASDRTSIAALPSGGFVSVWHEGGGKDGDGQGVFGRIIDENYNRSGEEFLINTLTTSHQSKAFVASLSDGTFMVVWSGGDGSSQGQVFSSSAVKIGEQFEIGPWFNQEAYIIGTADNKFMVVRGQNNQDSGILSVYDATGNLLIDDVVLTTAGKNLEIRIAEVGDNRFVASWFDSNNSVGSEIYGRIIDGSGESISADLQFNSTTLYNQQAPEVVGLKGDEHLGGVILEENGAQRTVETDYFIPLFGLTPKLGPIANWGLEIEKNAIKVDNSLDYQTNIPGIYAIGDVNTYPGKLKLILCGFHEATLMCQSVYQRMNPGKKYVLKYTTVSGVDGFDGSRKEAEKAVVKSIS